MPALPEPIGDVTFRLYAGDADIAALVALRNLASEADGLDVVHSEDAWRDFFAHIVGCDPLTDVLLAESPEGMVGYWRTHWSIEDASGTRVLELFGWSHPDVRSLGVDAAMLDWCERRLAEIAASMPHDGESVLQSYYDTRESAKEALLSERGYSLHEMYADMVRSLDEPIPDLPLPDGLRIVPKTIDDARAVWEADDIAFRDHVGHRKQTEADFQVFLAGHYCKDPSLWRVAEDGEGIAAMVLNYIDEDYNTAKGVRRGYTESISSQRRWRGKGVAKALIAESMRMFRDMGMTEAALGVHTANPTGAFRLYEGLGYRVTGESHDVRKPFTG